MFQGAADGTNTGGQPSLENDQGEGHVAVVTCARQGVGQGPVEVVGHVAGHLFVKFLLRLGQFHAQGFDVTGREEGAAVEVPHILFQATQEDGVLVLLHRPGQNLRAGKEVGVQQT